MFECNLRKGDLLVVKGLPRCGAGTGILLKQTSKYWYYYFEGENCRVHKKRLWSYIDANSHIDVKLGSTMKKRKKQPRWRTLDLHDTKHADVDEKIRKYLNWIDLPTHIITGNSSFMKSAVRKIAEEYGWSCRESVDYSGQLVVEEEGL